MGMVRFGVARRIGRGGVMARRQTAFAVMVLGLVLGGCSAARADKIRNGTAVFSGLDKITGRIVSFEAAMGETVQFGSLKVTSRACFTRPATEAPQTDTFVEVDEVSANKADKRIFSGWMFAASPGLHGIEHPIYDIWLKDCKAPGETIVEAPQTADAEDPTAALAQPAPGAPPNPDAPPPPPKPKPKRIVRQTPPVEVEPREPTQRFFPTSQYPSDFGGRDPAGNSRH